MAKNFAQLLHAAVEVHADRTVGEPGARGDFRAGHAFYEAKNQWLAIGFRQTEDCVQDGLRFHICVGRVAVWLALVAVRLRGFFIELVVRMRLAMKVHGAIRGLRQLQEDGR